MPRKSEEAREEENGPVKTPRLRTSTTASSDSSPNVTEAKPPTTASGITLPVTETPWSAEEEIRRRAYELYERDGRPDGRDREHWLLAETEILGRSAERPRKRSQRSA